MDVETWKSIAEFVKNVGAPSAILIAVIYGSYRVVKAATDHFIPPLVKSACHYIDKQSEVLDEHTAALNKISVKIDSSMDPRGNSRFDKHLFSKKSTNEALDNFASMALDVARQHGPEIQQIVQMHVTRIREALKG